MGQPQGAARNPGCPVKQCEARGLCESAVRGPRAVHPNVIGVDFDIHPLHHIQL